MTTLLLAALLALLALGVVTHKHTLNWSNGSNTLSGSKSFTDDLEHNISKTLSAGAADQLVGLAFTAANLTAFYALAVGADVTLETNSSSAAADTLVLKDGVPTEWNEDSGIPNPFGTNVTAAYLTNGSGSVGAQVEIRVLYH